MKQNQMLNGCLFPEFFSFRSHLFVITNFPTDVYECIQEFVIILQVDKIVSITRHGRRGLVSYLSIGNYQTLVRRTLLYIQCCLFVVDSQLGQPFVIDLIIIIIIIFQGNCLDIYQRVRAIDTSPHVDDVYLFPSCITH